MLPAQQYSLFSDGHHSVDDGHGEYQPAANYGAQSSAHQDGWKAYSVITRRIILKELVLKIKYFQVILVGEVLK